MRGKEVMLIYNDKLSVSPITTHIPLKTVSRIINAKLIISKTLTINSFYKKSLKKKPRIAILGLNQHNFRRRYRLPQATTAQPNQPLLSHH